MTGPVIDWRGCVRLWMEQTLGMEIEPFELENEAAYKMLVVLCLRAIYNEDRDALGPVGTEPRDTWDRGGTIAAGHAAYWGS